MRFTPWVFSQAQKPVLIRPLVILITSTCGRHTTTGLSRKLLFLWSTKGGTFFLYSKILGTTHLELHDPFVKTTTSLGSQFTAALYSLIIKWLFMTRDSLKTCYRLPSELSVSYGLCEWIFRKMHSVSCDSLQNPFFMPKWGLDGRPVHAEF